MKGACITAVEYALPAQKVTNESLALAHPAWKMEQVEKQSGVRSRGWCGPEETALDLAESACQQLLRRCGAARNEIDTVLFCTQSPDYVMPPDACLLQERLRLKTSVAALDFNLACSGYAYGLYLAKALIESGSAEQVLLVTAETYSRWIHPDDRGPMTLFGDAAAATLIGRGEASIGKVFLGTDGAGWKTFFVPAGGARVPRCEETARTSFDMNGNVRTPEHIFMDGHAVLDFVKKTIPPFIEQILREEKLSVRDVDLFVFHQASQVVLDFLFHRLDIPAEKQFNNLASIGNTVSASIPIALRDAELQGRLRDGMSVLVVGCGVGLSWGGCVLRWRNGAH